MANGPLRRPDDGEWILEVSLQEGRHRCRYLGYAVAAEVQNRTGPAHIKARSVHVRPNHGIRKREVLRSVGERVNERAKVRNASEGCDDLSNATDFGKRP